MMGTARAKGKPVHFDGRMVSGNFFTGLGVQPELGGLLGLMDESAAVAPRVVISHRWWVREFDRDPKAIGQQVNINGRSYAVAGVLPPEFTGVNPGWRADVFVCLSPTLPFNPDMPAEMGNMPGGYWLALMGRMRPGATNAQFQAKLNVALKSAVGAFISEPAGILLDGRAGTVSGRGELRQKLNLVSAVVGLVLLAACVNIAALLIARGHARHFELSLRGALGAGRGRLVRQMLTESLLLSLLGGGFGIVFALWGKLVVARIISRLPEGLRYNSWPDLKVLGFALAVTLLSVLLAGLLPAWRVTIIDPQPGLRDRSSTGSRRLRTGKILVVIQIALSLLLVTGAGLYTRTLVNLYRIDPGFATDHLLQFNLDPHALGVEVTRSVEYCECVEHALDEIPGVQSATLVSFVPAGSFGWEQFTLPSHPGNGKPIGVSVQFIGDGCFQTLRVPLLEGRELGAGDREGSPKVVVVNEAFAHRFLSDRPALGCAIDAAGSEWRVVGVCRDAKLHDIRQETEPTVFFPFRQRAAGSSSFTTYFALRTLVPPLSVAAQVEKVATGIDARVPPTNLYTQEELRDQSIATERASVGYYGSLAAFVLLLSSMGLYGLTAFEVSRRSTEFGIRLALGASRGQIIQPILHTAFLLAAAGLGLGLPLALGLTRFANASLYGVEATDPLTFLGSSILLSLVVFLATWIPAQRATRVDPLVALRVE
jgi:predicted permease